MTAPVRIHLPVSAGGSVSNLTNKVVDARGGELLSQRILRESDWNAPGLTEYIRHYKRSNYKNIAKEISKIQVAEREGIATFTGLLYMKRFNKMNEDGTPDLAAGWDDFGLVSCRKVTDAGVGFIVDAFQNLVELETMRYHGIGTSATAEGQTDTALGAELSTVYNPDSTRATGTLAESAANIFRSVATNTVDGSATIVEHGLFSQAATGGGVLLDRSVFGGIALVTGNALQSTYDFTVTAGS